MKPNDFILKQIQAQKEIDADFKASMKKAQMINEVFTSLFGPKLVPPNPSEVKVEKPLMYSDFERGVQNV